MGARVARRMHSLTRCSALPSSPCSAAVTSSPENPWLNSIASHQAGLMCSAQQQEW